MDKILVVGVLIAAGVITASILFVVFRTSLEESGVTSTGLQEQASERAQTALTIVEVIPGTDGSKVDLWVKNIGAIDIQPVRNIELFLVDINGDRGGYLRHSDTGPAFMEDTWSVVGPMNERLKPGETIQLHADLFRNPLNTGEFMFTLTSPNDVSASTLFPADPNAPLPPQPPPPPPPPQRFSLVTNAVAPNGGTVTGAGVYIDGTVARVAATANAGFTFDSFSGDCVTTATVCDVLMDADKSVTASFTQREFTLTAVADPVPGGNVPGSGPYPVNQVVTVTQTANPGFNFDSWSGDCTGTAPTCQVTMDSDKTVEARYSAVAPPPQPPAGCNPTPPGGAPVLNSITMNSGYPRQMLAVNGDTAGASVIWGAGSGTETTITTGVGGTQYFQIPQNATPGSYPVAIRTGANTSNIVCVTVLAVSGAFPAPRIEDIALNGRTGSDIAITVSAANMDADATLTVNGVPIANADLWGVLPIPYLVSHVPASYGYPIYHYSQLKGIVSNPQLGSTLTVRVTNRSGGSSTKSYTLPASWNLLDSDGDGLLDTWEDSGYTRPGGGFVDLPAMGASKYRKDILVESDWVAVATPTEGVFTASINTFAQATVLNPDGSSGIDLIIDRGQGGAFTEGGDILTPHNTIWFGGTSNGSYQNFYDYKPTNFNPDRNGIFHYNVFGRASPSGSSGVAEGPGGGPSRGDDFLVSCDWCNEGGLIGTFLHELGHNLNLHHGGLMWPAEPQDWHENPYRPNNPSIMSYRYQIGGTNTSCTKSSDGLYTYSQGQMRTINELNTDERIGICDNIALDLSEPFQDGIIATGVINSDDPWGRNSRFATADDTHVDQDQWGQIILDFRNYW